MVLVAIESAMRRGELLALRWENVKLEKGGETLRLRFAEQTIPVGAECQLVAKHRADRRPAGVSPGRRCFERLATMVVLENVSPTDVF